MYSLPNTFSRLSPGTVVRTWRGMCWHYGLIGFGAIDGTWAVVSFSPEGVVRESLHAFGGGTGIIIDGYPSDLPPQCVLECARSIADVPYNVGFWNCEHFVRYCHGLKPESEQVNTAALFAVGAILLLAA